MIIRITDDFDPDRIAQSGQCGDPDIAIRLVFRDPEGITVDAHSVIGIVTTRI